ncbi:hypothetical protein BH10ACT6_BH10ACT6_00290 [soil metagenome]
MSAQSTESHLPQTVAKQVPQRAVWDVALSIALLVFANASFLIGTILTIVLLVRRRRAWWVAMTTLLLIVAGGIVGFLLFATALNSR